MQTYRNNTHAAKDASTVPHFKTLAITTPKPFVFHVELNRPKKLNAINKEMWL